MKFFSVIMIILSFNLINFSFCYSQNIHFFDTKASKDFLDSINAQYVTSKTLKTDDFSDYLSRNVGKQGIKQVHSIIGLWQEGSQATIEFFYINQDPRGAAFLESSSQTFTRVEPSGLWVRRGGFRIVDALLWKKN